MATHRGAGDAKKKPGSRMTSDSEHRCQSTLALLMRRHSQGEDMVAMVLGKRHSVPIADGEAHSGPRFD